MITERNLMFDLHLSFNASKKYCFWNRTDDTTLVRGSCMEVGGRILCARLVILQAL